MTDLAALRALDKVGGRPPDQVLVVAVERVLAHCPKCRIRSGPWKPAAWPDVADVPSLAETLIARAKIGDPVETVAASLEEGNRERPGCASAIRPEVGGHQDVVRRLRRVRPGAGPAA